ncbi:nucleotidyltransferase family protein [Nocardia sp. NPDC024068]|uniref:nucleotidyltransferase family protein n=1 Tax=Nocardia sp. NPDC024068 TaxID=3157197 RepID=UPI00340363B8
MNSVAPRIRAAGVVLAAGAGRRFGRPKADVRFEGERLVDRAVRLLRDGGCERVVVVSGAVALEVDGAEVVHNPGWVTGMGSSLTVGLVAVREPAAVVVPVDMPWLGAGAVRRLLTCGTDLAVATYDGRPGHPVLLGSRYFAAVSAEAVGDIGARRFLAANPDLVQRVPCEDTGSPADIDTPRDLPG